MVDMPTVVRSKAKVAGAADWLAAIDDVVAELVERWRLEVGEAYGGGTEALVLAATRDDGSPAVLKLLVPRDGDAARHEIAVLRHAGGDGCARLLEADEDRHALLLERLGPSMHDLGLPYQERLDVLADLAHRVWRPAPDVGLPTGAEKAAWLGEHITATWEALDEPCSEAVVEHALACAARRRAAHDDDRAVLVHGDIHQWNALRRGDGWALIDPDGLVAEPEYDLGVVLREDPVGLLGTGDPWGVARRLAGRCRLDPVAVWEWGAVERVSTGLLCERIGLQPVGRQMLDAAESLLPGRTSAAPRCGLQVTIRPATASDETFLWEVLGVAADWRSGAVVRSPDELRSDPALARYVAGWRAEGDVGVVAVDRGGEPVGAAWCRRFDAADPGYGFVAADVPEVSVGVVAGARGQGIGRRLLEALAKVARDAGVERLSLSVEVENPAMALYERLGYVVVAEAPGSATMVLDLRSSADQI